MKILIVCSSLNGGGAERVAVNLANRFSKEGHSVVFFTRHKTVDCYTLDRSVLRVFPRFGGFINQVLSIREILNKRDVDLLISFTDVPNVAAFLAAFFSKACPVFIPTVHTNLKARDVSLKKGIKFRVIRFLHKLACRNSSSVVSVSSGAESALIDYYGVDSDRVLTIWNPVLSNEIDVSDFRRPFNHAHQIKLVGAGRLTEAKNFFLMLDVVKNLDDVFPNKYTLDIYGEGELKGDLELYSERLGIKKNVTFKGFVDDLQVRLAGYSIFVFTSSWEGFGNVLVEALCAGIPVISTDCPSGPKEILADGKFGRLVPVGNVEAFSAAIEEEVINPLSFSRDEIVNHLDGFREDTVMKKYIDLVMRVKSSEK
ncbi:MAG: glycosyltransferase [Thalassolituus sp.]|jgi:glycosyltransferase involved in cell wall biosynthesis